MSDGSHGDTDGSDPVVEAVFDAVAATAPAIRDALPGRRVE
ncbi:class 1 fructose-bisphosphatase, partial [Halorubrum tibetense]